MNETDEPTDRLETVGATTLLVCDLAGPPVASEADALDLVGSAGWQGADWVVLPAARLSEDFFRLSTRLAGAITQKFVTYRIGLAVVGDISARTGNSAALRDFVRESNHGRHLWFLDDLEAVQERLRN